MGENSKIEWTHHTFNPWRGCTKISKGCEQCYAADLSKRNPATLGIWGPRGSRAPAAESYWRQLAKWDREAKAAGERRRVFVASLADIGERDETMPAESRPIVAAARTRLWHAIQACDGLDFLLLTKRPDHLAELLEARFSDGLPDNIWAGTSVEDQAAADLRIPQLLEIPAKVCFLSCEPLLGPVTLRSDWLPEVGLAVECSVCRKRKKPYGRSAPMAMANGLCDQDCPGYFEAPRAGDLWPFESRKDFGFPTEAANRLTVSWTIVGGESGAHARPMHPDWARSLRDQCVAAGVPFHFKQFGEWAPANAVPREPYPLGVHPSQTTTKRLNLEGEIDVYRFGKHLAGRLLDGREWNEVPGEA